MHCSSRLACFDILFSFPFACYSVAALFPFTVRNPIPLPFYCTLKQYGALDFDLRTSTFNMEVIEVDSDSDVSQDVVREDEDQSSSAIDGDAIQIAKIDLPQ